MLQRTLFFLLLFFLPFAAFTQDCSHGDAFTYLDINNVRAGLPMGGALWWDGSDGKYFAPKPTNGSAEISAIFAGGLWMGGSSASGEFKVAAQLYGNGSNQSDMFPGPLNPTTGTAYENGCTDWDRHFSVLADEINAHISDFSIDGDIDDPISSIFGWPGKDNVSFSEYAGIDLPAGQGLAPFVDTDNDGIYNPNAGDYPDIKGDQAIWWVFNDAAAVHTQSNGSIIRMEIQAMAYAFSSFEPTINNTTFYDFKYIYRGLETLEEFQVALWADVDLGCSTDDNVGFDTSRNMAFYYNQDAEDGSTSTNCSGIPTYGTEIPLLGIKLLCDSQDTGVTGFTYFSNPGVSGAPPSQTDPTSVVEYIRYMTNKWRDGTPLTFGGNGYDPEGTPTNYAFPGNPSNSEEWSICSAASQNSPDFDRRTVMSTSINTLNPGDINTFTYAVIFVPDVPHPCPDITPLQEAADFLDEFDCNISNITQVAQEKTIDIRIAPNPAQNYITLIFANVENKAVHLEITDVTGKVVQKYEQIDFADAQFSTENLPTGMYFLRAKMKTGETAVGKFLRL